MQKRIPTLDLFSGIGGFAYGLHSICSTIAYCEKDKCCQEVLRQRMSDGIIDVAPIFDDICTLSLKDL